MKSIIQSGNPLVWLIGKTCALAVAMVAAGIAYATPTVTIDSVAQRWPWNNKVDITYTVADGTDMAKAATGERPYYKIAFTATIDGTEYPIDGSKDIIAKTTAGTHTVTWTNAPSGVRASNCKMGAKLYSTSAYYMIVDLDTGHFAFDGLEGSDTPTATPTASNARYNTDLYKTDRLVLRRVPRTAAADATYASGYPTGDNGMNVQLKNTATNWVTSSDYFIGVFDTTISQYVRLLSPQNSNLDKRPVTDTNKPDYIESRVRYTILRNSHSAQDALGSDSSSDSFLERLNALTGLPGFDLPTEVMSEIACRAGYANCHYFYGSNTGSSNYYWLNQSDAQPVGGKPANRWGLYDVAGNVYEICRDGDSCTDPADMSDPWTPAAEKSGSTDNHLFRNGAAANDTNANSMSFYASRYQFGPCVGTYYGFRVAFLATWGN